MSQEEEKRVILKNNSSTQFFGIAAIGVKFDCPNCGNRVMTGWEVDIPYPNFSADTANDSENSEFTAAQCGKCEEEFEIHITNGYGGGWIGVEKLDDDAEIETIQIPEPPDYELEASLSNSEFKETFDGSINNIIQLSKISIPDEVQQKLLFGNLFVSVITSMETYLSDAFLNVVDKRDSLYLRKFVAAFQKYQDKKIKISEIFDFTDGIKQDALKHIRDLTFHNIEQSKYLYGKVLDINFPEELGGLFKIIDLRHDLVHRNGKTKDGNDIQISDTQLTDTITQISDFVEFIDKQIVEI